MDHSDSWSTDDDPRSTRSKKHRCYKCLMDTVHFYHTWYHYPHRYDVNSRYELLESFYYCKICEMRYYDGSRAFYLYGSRTLVRRSRSCEKKYQHYWHYRIYRYRTPSVFLRWCAFCIWILWTQRISRSLRNHGNMRKRAKANRSRKQNF